ncbi:hypoxanthine-guanine phosphoribosyltransferase [gamma proteobacterium HTCC5015]|nr:hypoxanthine-guanine phosphoribosyltransferase [gamma proteobacterium HTCC5015]
MSDLNNAMKIYHTAQVLHDEATIAECLDKMAGKITLDYTGLDPLVLCVMNGGLYFTAELTKRLEFPMQVDYLHATRYGDDSVGKEVVWKAMPQAEVAGRHVLVLDDILDEGYTLAAIQNALQEQGAASVRMAVLTEKQHDRRCEGVNAKYVGLQLPDRFVFGCGMDYKGYFRNLRAIYGIEGI